MPYPPEVICSTTTLGHAGKGTKRFDCIDQQGEWYTFIDGGKA